MFTFLRVIIPINLNYLSILHCNINNAARLLGVNNKAISELQVAVEELFSHLCKNYQGDLNDSSEFITLSLKKSATTLDLSLNYQGPPQQFKFNEKYDSSNLLSEELPDQALETLLVKSCVDFFTFKNNGPNGLEFYLQKYLSHQSIDEIENRSLSTIDPTDRPEKTVLVESEEQIFEVTKLIYSSYGSSYVYEDMYYPERVKQLINSNELYSLVNITSKGLIAGHAALVRPYPNSPVAEWGIAVTNPQCRGKGVMKALIGDSLVFAKTKDIEGVFAQSVTNHPFTQKACNDFKMSETALMLGYAPATLKFKNISDQLAQRESTFINYISLKKNADKVKICIPDRYHHIVKEIYSKVLNTDVEITNADEQSEAEKGSVTTLIKSALNIGVISIDQIGRDTIGILHSEMRRLQNQRVDVIYVNLNMELNLNHQLMTALKSHDCFFTGVFPHHPYKHTLVLQKMNNYEINFDKIVADAPLAIKIKDFVMKDYQECLS